MCFKHIPLLLLCSANKLKHCISRTIHWIFLSLQRRNESLGFFKGTLKKWRENVQKRKKKERDKKRQKRSLRPAFDQHHNLITCIPKRAFIWVFLPHQESFIHAGFKGSFRREEKSVFLKLESKKRWIRRLFLWGSLHCAHKKLDYTLEKLQNLY